MGLDVFMSSWDRWRKNKNLLSGLVISLTAVIAVVPLTTVLWYVVKKGLPMLNLNFFTNLPAPVGIPGGGMGNAVIGTLILVGIAGVISIPIGISAGMFLAERRNNWFSSLVRLIADVLSGAPSIVVGIFIYTVIVVPMGKFSALAGGIALAVLMIPTLTRTTEEMLKMVPHSLREASLALGATPTQTLLHVLLPAAARGIITGIMLAVARVMGETAPLIMTAFGSVFWPTALTEPIAALPLQIFVYAISPYHSWQAQAWTGALTLLIIVLFISITARLLTRSQNS